MRAPGRPTSDRCSPVISSSSTSMPTMGSRSITSGSTLGSTPRVIPDSSPAESKRTDPRSGMREGRHCSTGITSMRGGSGPPSACEPQAIRSCPDQSLLVDPPTAGQVWRTGRMVLLEGRGEPSMGLNIKNEETHRLVQQLAQLTGETQTAAVTAAVRERLERIQRVHSGGLSDRLLAIGADAARRLPKRLRTVDHGALLYDENGLPR